MMGEDNLLSGSAVTTCCIWCQSTMTPAVSGNSSLSCACAPRRTIGSALEDMYR